MKLKLLNTTEIKDYPSGSALEFHEGVIYLAGDDARDLLVMNRKWKKRRLIPLVQSAEKRLPKKAKLDLEAMSLIQFAEQPHLLILGSGSAPLRNQAILVNLENRAVASIDITLFYERLRNSGVPALNIEGAATVGERLVLANRGNKSQPVNHLIITTTDFFNRQDTAPLQVVRAALPSTGESSRISGLAYSARHDCLLYTLSTEDTTNPIDDGPIGKSYLGKVENFLQKIVPENTRLELDELLDLSEADKAFARYKIESVCIQSERNQSMKIHLAADNDTGVSYLFKARLEL
jgi:hypothetical protein